MLTSRSAITLRIRPLAVVAALGVVAFATLPATEVEAAWAGKEVVKDDVTHVMNPADGMEKAVTLKPKEVFRLGGDDEDEIFGVVTTVLADDDGNFYMLDAQLSEIKVYSADGEYQRTIGRKGEGPGEFQRAFSMFRVPGDKIGVLNVFPSQIIQLSFDGKPAGNFAIPDAEGEGFRALIGAVYAGKNLALAYVQNKPSQEGFTQGNVLSLISGDGKTETRLFTQDASMVAAKPVISEKEWDTFRNRWVASPDGRTFSAVELGKYSINVWGADGKLAQVIERDYPKHVRSKEESARILEIYKGFTRQIPIPNIEYQIEPNWNPVGRLYAREDGTLWVQSSRGANGLADGVMGIFDVFDKSGKFVRQVTLEGQGDPQNDGFFFVKDRLFVVTDFLSAMMALQGGGGQAEEAESEAEPMEIISYKLTM